MLGLLLLPVQIFSSAAKATLGVIKWILSYRLGKVVIGCMTVTAAVQYGGYPMSYWTEMLIIFLVAVIAVIVLIGPPIYHWWRGRRQKHQREEQRRQAERNNHW